MVGIAIAIAIVIVIVNMIGFHLDWIELYWIVTEIVLPIKI